MSNKNISVNNAVSEVKKSSVAVKSYNGIFLHGCRYAEGFFAERLV